MHSVPDVLLFPIMHPEKQKRLKEYFYPVDMYWIGWY